MNSITRVVGAILIVVGFFTGSVIYLGQPTKTDHSAIATLHSLTVEKGPTRRPFILNRNGLGLSVGGPLGTNGIGVPFGPSISPKVYVATVEYEGRLLRFTIPKNDYEQLVDEPEVRLWVDYGMWNTPNIHLLGPASKGESNEGL